MEGGEKNIFWKYMKIPLYFEHFKYLFRKQKTIGINDKWFSNGLARGPTLTVPFSFV